MPAHTYVSNAWAPPSTSQPHRSSSAPDLRPAPVSQPEQLSARSIPHHTKYLRAYPHTPPPPPASPLQTQPTAPCCARVTKGSRCHFSPRGSPNSLWVGAPLSPHYAYTLLLTSTLVNIGKCICVLPTGKCSVKMPLFPPLNLFNMFAWCLCLASFSKLTSVLISYFTATTNSVSLPPNLLCLDIYENFELSWYRHFFT